MARLQAAYQPEARRSGPQWSSAAIPRGRQAAKFKPGNHATVAELVDAQDLGSCGATRGGSSPSGRIAPENNAPPPGVRSWTADTKWRWPDGPAMHQVLRLNHVAWDQTAQDAHWQGGAASATPRRVSGARRRAGPPFPP